MDRGWDACFSYVLQKFSSGEHHFSLASISGHSKNITKGWRLAIREVFLNFPKDWTDFEWSVTYFPVNLLLKRKIVYRGKRKDHSIGSVYKICHEDVNSFDRMCNLHRTDESRKSHQKHKGANFMTKLKKKKIKILVLSYVCICSRTLLIFLTAADLNLNKVIRLIKSFSFSFFRIGLWLCHALQCCKFWIEEPIYRNKL